jgi:hypothetical protein
MFQSFYASEGTVDSAFSNAPDERSNVLDGKMLVPGRI